MSQSKTNNCSGDCCSSFPIMGMTFEGLAAWAMEVPGHTELQKIVSMVVPLEEAPAVCGRNGDQPWPRFTCIHFDPVNKLCRDYENRPRMCSEFPYDTTCNHCNLNRAEIEWPREGPIQIAEKS